MKLGRTRRVHFVGIGGIGMSGIAELLVNLGYAVSGSDARRSPATATLEALGAAIFEGHAPAHVGDADVVVFSSAIRDGNPEIEEARRRGIPVIPRAEMLGELMRLRFSVAVAGSHGKTTTTSMIALVLERAGLDPTAVIGGRLEAFGSNARLGTGEFMVAEADESDRSFLRLWPSVAVITNVDREHLESYGDFADLQRAFGAFANKVPFYGCVVACADDAGLADVLPGVERRLLTYGLDARDADFLASHVDVSTSGARCLVHRQRPEGRACLGPLALAVPGRHNLQNALAAVAVAEHIGVPFDVVAGALAEFQGAQRRFERIGEVDGIVVIDDYGHHPTEIRAVLAAARSSMRRRLMVVFQPHRYSRTQAHLADFGDALREADELVLTDIYPAGEDPIPGTTIEALAAAVARDAGRLPHVAPQLHDIVPAVLERVRPGDAVIVLGAGSIGTVARPLLAALEARRRAS
ncbi:MAG: UDP-N-acetylmuramate--L-alanine ligase [Vicinamibacterales bacterium]